MLAALRPPEWIERRSHHKRRGRHLAFVMAPFLDPSARSAGMRSRCPRLLRPNGPERLLRTTYSRSRRLRELCSSAISAIGLNRVQPTELPAAIGFESVECHQRNPRLHKFSRRAGDTTNHAVPRRADRQLHLHRFKRDEHVAFGHPVADRDLHGGHRGRHR